MSTVKAATDTPLLASLPGLPQELCLAVIEQCDMPSILALSQTSRHFHRLANPYDKSRQSLMTDFLIKVQDFHAEQDGFVQTIQETLLHSVRSGDGSFATGEPCEAR